MTAVEKRGPEVDPERAQDLVDAIRAILAGESRYHQGWAVADITAMWIAGHVAADGDQEKLWSRLLAQHVKTVRKLIPVNFESIIKPELEARRAGKAN